MSAQYLESGLLRQPRKYLVTTASGSNVSKNGPVAAVCDLGTRRPVATCLYQCPSSKKTTRPSWSCGFLVDSSRGVGRRVAALAVAGVVAHRLGGGVATGGRWG